MSSQARPSAWKKRYWIGVLAIALLGVGIYVFYARSGQAQSRRNAEGAPAARPVSVVTAKAKTGDMNVYLTGLGTVMPLNTVTVKTRVDGQLIRVLFREGQFVQSGDLLAEIDPRPFQVMLEQAEGQLAKDQALLKNAQVDLERYQVLFQQDSVAKQQLDTQAALVRQYEAQLKVDQGQIDNAKLQLTYCRITAPLSGRVGLRLVDPGNIVHAADANGLLVITQLDPISVIFTISEDNLPQVQKQINGGRQLPAVAYDRSLNHKLASGSLMTVDNQIDPTTGTVKLKAVFSNKQGELFPNQFVNARLLVDTLHNMVLVPNASIQHSPQSAFVYVVKADNTVDARNVKVAGTEGDQTAIASGLKEGENVVTDGVDKLQPGSRVVTRAPQRTAS
ncbi:MAG TPA: MdtA/MuxA family multidrug efflux RND transporter periplasmic adaptor subunit [Candidatus Binatia bacterium]|jgi:multidrug efflux system membrane fusion protein